MAKVFAVVGANFGDEGKGLCTDFLSNDGSLVIRHNGGAQAGHTVERIGKRFVFHQLSSGSFDRAATLWAKTFLPDLYKIGEELSDFFAVSGFLPRLCSEASARVTLIDDVLNNMALESSRGNARHGSCGMGVNEANLRNEAGFSLTVSEIKGMTCAALAARMKFIRDEYSLPRFISLGLDPSSEYGELIRDPNVIENAAAVMKKGADSIEMIENAGGFVKDFDTVIFEGAQGLLLDSENTEYAPHVTASRTGLHNPLLLCRDYGLELDTAVFVTRSYLTRHGAGALTNERDPKTIGIIEPDKTNLHNEWQGSLRCGVCTSPEALAETILKDAKNHKGKLCLLVTHLNETDGYIRFLSGDVPARELLKHPAFKGKFDGLLLSFTKYSNDIILISTADTGGLYA